MNIIYHHRTQGTGAEGVHIAYVIKGLRELGHQVRVISPNDAEPEHTAGNNPFAAKRGLKARCFAFLSRHAPQFLFEMLELGYNAAAQRKLEQAVQREHIDFIYERNAFFLFAGARLARKHSLPLIVEVNEIAGEQRVRRQFLVGWAKRIEREVFEQADAIIVVSDFLKDRIAQTGIPAAKIHVIPNAVDPREFDPAAAQPHALRERYGFNPSAVVVGFIGWFVAWHNLELLIEVFARAARGKNVFLFLVGDGGLKGKFQELARQLGIEGQVIFPGAAPYHDIPNYVAAMDVCVIPGSNEYRSPIKLFEYMAMAKAVLAPRLRPIEVIVQDQQDGVLFKSDDPEELLQALQRLLQDTSWRASLGTKARAKILECYTWTHNAQRVIAIFNSLQKRG